MGNHRTKSRTCSQETSNSEENIYCTESTDSAWQRPHSRISKRISHHRQRILQNLTKSLNKNLVRPRASQNRFYTSTPNIGHRQDFHARTSWGIHYANTVGTTTIATTPPWRVSPKVYESNTKKSLRLWSLTVWTMFGTFQAFARASRDLWVGGSSRIFRSRSCGSLRPLSQIHTANGQYPVNLAFNKNHKTKGEKAKSPKEFWQNSTKIHR